MSSYAQTPCSTWGSTLNTSMGAFGLSAAGEFSNAVTDCGLWVNGVGLGTRYEGTYTGTWPVVGNCTSWTDWQTWDATMKTGIMNFALASMDALQVCACPSSCVLPIDVSYARTGSSGLGKSVTPRLPASWSRRNGLIPSDCRMDGCLRILVLLPELARIKTYGTLHSWHGRQVARALDKLLHLSVRNTPGHLPPSATLGR
jgi:hypothetical protein